MYSNFGNGINTQRSNLKFELYCKLQYIGFPLYLHIIYFSYLIASAKDNFCENSQGYGIICEFTVCLGNSGTNFPWFIEIFPRCARENFYKPAGNLYPNFPHKQ